MLLGIFKFRSTKMSMRLICWRCSTTLDLCCHSKAKVGSYLGAGGSESVPCHDPEGGAQDLLFKRDRELFPCHPDTVSVCFSQILPMVDHFFLLNRGPGPLGMVAQAANDGDHVAAQQWAETLGHKLFD